jgi:hypothetical protein
MAGHILHSYSWVIFFPLYKVFDTLGFVNEAFVERPFCKFELLRRGRDKGRIGIEIESEEHAHHELERLEVKSGDRATPLGRMNWDVGPLLLVSPLQMYIIEPATWLKSR